MYKNDTVKKSPQDAKAHSRERVSAKNSANKKERFFETLAFTVCVNRPLAYTKYADGDGFLSLRFSDSLTL